MAKNIRVNVQFAIDEIMTNIKKLNETIESCGHISKILRDIAKELESSKMEQLSKDVQVRIDEVEHTRTKLRDLQKDLEDVLYTL